MAEPTAPIELLREIARQGEVRLNSLLALATAADLRATTLCGIFGAAAVGTSAATLASLTVADPNSSLILAGVVASLGLFIAAVVAAISGAPRNFYVGGGNPDRLRDWAWTGEGWRDIGEMLDATAMRYADIIEKNREILEAGSWRIIVSLGIGFASPCLAIIAYFGSILLCH